MSCFDPPPSPDADASNSSSVASFAACGLREYFEEAVVGVGRADLPAAIEEGSLVRYEESTWTATDVRVAGGRVSATLEAAGEASLDITADAR
eukprot:CAMPEP_0119283496 /NCGR_PEP_ID=MMETSP1329-20130426/28600_1 /TAXON_ID=114041 /ORGANISM="Genus nov. species nov., Strain RCC1024" /LENGTH=92 /DNA_ID=CAMNT_0007284169 /DNA_START=66 /DNA_END=341 /DNA_ORIENTATION=-